jgi:hypothetical protein
MTGNDFAWRKAMTTTSRNRKRAAINLESCPNLAWIATSVVALALGLMVCANAFAQSTAGQKTAVASEDMRLWSFGDCDRRFPYVDTPEHKECVRVVGSPEAVEARALRVCDVSHAADKEEAERCKATYKANKVKAAADGVVANAPAAPQAPPSAEMMRRVKAITTAAVEAERAAATPEAPATVEEAEPSVSTPEESTWKGTLMTVLLVAVGVGVGVNLFRRRQAQSA